MNQQEIKQLGVVLVAAGPGLTLAALVSAMTLPAYDFLRVLFAWEGVLSTLGCTAVGVVVILVPDLPRLAKALRFGFIPFLPGFIGLETLYTDYPEVEGLLTSLSSVVYTIVVVTSLGGLMFVLAQVDRVAKRDPRRGRVEETFLP